MSIEGEAEGAPSGFQSFTTAADTQQNTAERLKQMQIENGDLWFAACDSVRKDTQRAILTAVNKGVGSCTRQELTEYTSVSDRTIRKHLGKLKEKELIETVESRTQAVSFASFEANVLVPHTLDCYYNAD
jgi:DNA-binding transcriptional ArsR family regulator